MSALSMRDIRPPCNALAQWDRPALRHPLLHIKPGNTENKPPQERHQRLDWRIECKQERSIAGARKARDAAIPCTEETGHAETGERADGSARPMTPLRCAGRACVHARECACKVELRNRLILWSQDAFGLSAALIPVISDLKQALTRRSALACRARRLKHCIGAFSPL